MLSACFHISRQTIDIFLEFVRVSILKPGKFIVRKKNILIFTETAAGYLSSFCLNQVYIFLFCITCGQFLPHTRWSFLHFHRANISLWWWRKLHPIGQMQEYAVSPVPTLTDASDKPRIFQLVQRGFYCPFASVEAICHLLYRVNDIHISVLWYPPRFLRKHGAVEQQPIEQLCIYRMFACNHKSW